MSDKKILDKNVRRGIKRLNEKIPRWFDDITEIDLKDLDISDEENCITAIILPGSYYPDRLATFGIDQFSSSEYGFDVNFDLDMEGQDQYDYLAKRWRKYIRLFQEVAP